MEGGKFKISRGASRLKSQGITDVADQIWVFPTLYSLGFLDKLNFSPSLVNLGSTISSAFFLTLSLSSVLLRLQLFVFGMCNGILLSQRLCSFFFLFPSFLYRIISGDLSPSSWIISSAWSNLPLSPSSVICHSSYCTF